MTTVLKDEDLRGEIANFMLKKKVLVFLKGRVFKVAKFSIYIILTQFVITVALR